MSGTDLEQRLARLADGDVALSVPSPADLWARGRRWQRRRRLAARLTAVCAVVLSAGCVGALLPLLAAGTPEPVPASDDVAATVPDRVFQPSPWLGTLGPTPLVALTWADRGGWGSSLRGLVGISAQTGEYGFLDLPDLANEAVELSPDGHHLAYWFAGDPHGEPQTGDGQFRPAVGLALRDLRTGQERRREVETEHGIGGTSLFWIDDDTLVFEYGHYLVGDSAPVREQGGVRMSDAQWWSLDNVEPTAWPWPQEVPDPGFWSARDGKVMGPGRGGLVLLDPRDDERMRVRGDGGAGISVGNASPLILGPQGRVAVLGSRNSQQTPNRVWTSRLASAGGALELRGRTAVPGVEKALGMFGWRDGDVLALMRLPGGETDLDEAGLVAVDPLTGSERVMVRAADPTWQFARGLLETAEIAEGRPPPDPADPRLMAAAWAGGLVVVLGAFFLWRRRGHP